MQILDTNKFINQATSTSEPLQPMLDAGNARVLVLNLASGQAVDPCQMTFLVLYYFIEGEGEIQVEGQKLNFHPGSLLFVPADATRSITADLPTSVLIVQIP